MTPIIVHSPSRESTDTYVEGLIKTHAISQLYVTRFEPETKEFSIKQVRELIKSTMYAPSETRLFVLYDFDTASIEAQNAFLKTLEEHNPHDLFVMEARQPQRLLPTIQSRSNIEVLEKAKAGRDRTTDFEKVFTSPVPPLNNPLFQANKYENPLEPFDLLISYLRTRLPTNRHASSILREILVSRTRVRENNLNAQYALDRVLIFIYKNR